MLHSFGGGSLFGRSTGSATPRVLALHGWARTHSDFDAVLAPAPEAGGRTDPELDAIAVDLPGFGSTPAPPEPWGSAEYADAVAAVLDDMVSPVVVLGHSFGGRVALQLAARRPAQVGAVVLTGVPNLVASPGSVSKAPAPFRLLRALHGIGLVSNGRMEAARQRFGSADYRNAEGVMRQVLVKSVGEHYEEQLEVIACPVTLVWGDDDTASPLSVAKAAMTRLADATLIVAPGAGHLTPLTVPGVLRTALEERLR